jgi:Skp family chaperone for outer membrane proteins
MSDWIGLGLILLILFGAVVGLARLGKAPEPISPEEFERRVQEARGTTRAGAAAGLYALQKLMNPRAAEAVEVQRDLSAGYYDEAEQSGEGGLDDEGEAQAETGDASGNEDASESVESGAARLSEEEARAGDRRTARVKNSGPTAGRDGKRDDA